MTETSSLLLGILVGVVLGTTTLLIYKYFPTNDSKDENDTIEKSSQFRKSVSRVEAESAVTKETDFPVDWFTSTENFNLETRAIFSKCWILLTHASRFSKPGDYHTFTLCGYSIFLILGKDYNIRAFHNVCRHRAYTVTRKESGSSTVLGCKYHGWSYDVKGQLVKAPMFDGVPGFRKEDNGLFEVPLRVSERSGMVWINLDAAKMNEGDDHAETRERGGVDSFLKLGHKKSRWIDGRTVEGGFNWKSAVNTEIFSIGIPHLPIPILLRPWLGKSSNRTSASRSFPCSMVYKIPDTNLWYSVSLMPSSSTKTQIRWDLYSNSTKPNAALEKTIISQIEGLISIQAKALESSAQVVDDGNSDTQSEILGHLKAHLRVERALGKEVKPAMNKAKTSDKFLQAETLCKELDCLSGGTSKTNTTSQNILAW